MFIIFSNIIERALKKCEPTKAVLIPNDESDITIPQKRVTEETGNVYKKSNSRMNSKDLVYSNLQNDFIQKPSANFLDGQN